ncbi:hypothetical protein N7450_011440 [Penicillium hetheringtonii]|uniref:Uncharacterized protein n=1 Tax=Penicillium hetheringtonii TaxID=911720 RepID=A0AAD6GNN0_9EURO|nr:hypothetical protein N7450_011440 [Penicillium hetheringtonii]
MLPQIWVILCGAAAITGAQTVRLLLPGFQGRELEARILSYDEQATTFVLTCPRTVAAPDCGVSEAGMTAIAKDESIELVDVNKRNRLDIAIHLKQIQG